jgi:hypothetical protein
MTYTESEPSRSPAEIHRDGNVGRARPAHCLVRLRAFHCMPDECMPAHGRGKGVSVICFPKSIHADPFDHTEFPRKCWPDWSGYAPIRAYSRDPAVSKTRWRIATRLVPPLLRGKSHPENVIGQSSSRYAASVARVAIWCRMHGMQHLPSNDGCAWITTNRDFAHFPGLTWRAPLDDR